VARFTRRQQFLHRETITCFFCSELISSLPVLHLVDAKRFLISKILFLPYPPMAEEMLPLPPEPEVLPKLPEVLPKLPEVPPKLPPEPKELLPPPDTCPQ
jgi:hypothetical protein